MTGKRPRQADLREACISEALGIIETHGVEMLSLREVARRLGVSHQAPYRHYPTRDHILAEIIARAFAAFAAALDARPASDDPAKDLGAMGEAYLAYARTHPLQYRLMFGTPLPDPGAHPAMMRQAKHAFSLLTEGLRRVRVANGRAPDEGKVLLDALFIWSALHGLAGIGQSGALGTLDLPSGVLDAAAGHVLERIGIALEKAKP